MSAGGVQRRLQLGHAQGDRAAAVIEPIQIDFRAVTAATRPPVLAKSTGSSYTTGGCNLVESWASCLIQSQNACAKGLSMAAGTTV